MNHKTSLTHRQWLYIALVAALFGVIGMYFVTSSRAAVSGTLAVNQPSSSLALGSDFTVTITEDSGTTPVNAVEADLKYDQTKLQFKSISQTGSGFNLTASASGGNGTVTIGSGASPAITGSQTVAVVTFTAIGLGTSSITFAPSSGIAQASDSSDYLAATMPGSYTVADKTGPSVPASVASSAQTATSITLGWSAATDNVGVTGYKIFRGGTQVGTSASTSFTNTGLSPSTAYSYTVQAYDAAGNVSALSSAANVSTTPDTTAPTAPASLTMATHTLTSISLSWAAATDNVGVTAYKIYRGGSQIGTSASTSFTDTGLTPGTAYSYTVVATDAAGNLSTASAASSFSTLADTSAPTTPVALNTPTQTTSSISLSWAAATDNVGVTGYKIFRGGTQIATSPVASYIDLNLSTGTSYSYNVAAYDAAGNVSAQSSALSASTSLLAGDANHDNHVDYHDLSVLAGSWLSTTDLRADFNHDGIVDFHDLSALAGNWGK